jgi:hypothetical protein
MSQVLNNLNVTGTSSNSQALGVTGGYGNFNNLKVGSWVLPSTSLDIVSSGTNSSTYTFKAIPGYGGPNAPF